MTYAPARFVPREANRIGTTNMINEVGAALNALQPAYTAGLASLVAKNQFAFIGRVVSSGPNGESDFPDARYWMKIQYISADAASAAVTLKDDLSDTDNLIFCVTNLSDLPPGGAGGGTHTLEIGAFGLVFVEGDKEDGNASPDDGDGGEATTGAADSRTPVAHYVMSVGGSLPPPQYENMYPQAGAQLTYIASYGHGFMMNPAP